MYRNKILCFIIFKWYDSLNQIFISGGWLRFLFWVLLLMWVMEIPSGVISGAGSEIQMQAHVIFNLVYILLHGKYTVRWSRGRQIGSYHSHSVNSTAAVKHLKPSFVKHRMKSSATCCPFSPGIHSDCSWSLKSLHWIDHKQNKSLFSPGVFKCVGAVRARWTFTDS